MLLLSMSSWKLINKTTTKSRGVFLNIRVLLFLWAMCFLSTWQSILFVWLQDILICECQRKEAEGFLGKYGLSSYPTVKRVDLIPKEDRPSFGTFFSQKRVVCCKRRSRKVQKRVALFQKRVVRSKRGSWGSKEGRRVSEEGFISSC